MRHAVKILMSEFVSHDTRRFILDKPERFKVRPGQAALLALPDKEEDLHPFTPTSLMDWGVLEFTIKEYRDHHGMTERLHQMGPGDELLIKGTYGAIAYKGPGVFIAGGTGITPFIAILRQLHRDGKAAGNTLIFSNKTHADILLERELNHYLGERCFLTLTRESRPGYDNRRVDAAYLKEKIANFDQEFYLCGPPAFVDAVAQTLKDAGAKPSNVVFD